MNCPIHIAETKLTFWLDFDLAKCNHSIQDVYYPHQFQNAQVFPLHNEHHLGQGWSKHGIISN